MLKVSYFHFCFIIKALPVLSYDFYHISGLLGLNESTVATKTKNQKWCPESAKLIKTQFKERFLTGGKVTGKEIEEFIEEHPILSKRNKADIRSYLYWDIKRDRKRMSLQNAENIKGKMKKSLKRKINYSPDELSQSQSHQSQKRNRVKAKASIYACFKEFIERKEIPEMAEICKAY